MLYLTQMNIYNRITKQAQSPKLITIQISKKQGGKPMTFKFATDEWIKELSRQLNASEAYEKSASNWEGDFVFIIDAEPGKDAQYMYLDLYHGKSPGAGVLKSLDEKDAEYVISANKATWQKVIKGKLDPIQGMMTKQLKLTGNMMQVMRYPKAAKEIVSCCALIPTDFD
jgi:putative sterol carrier protein